jgi:CheY-like chemotaxis protein
MGHRCDMYQEMSEEGSDLLAPSGDTDEARAAEEPISSSLTSADEESPAAGDEAQPALDLVAQVKDALEHLYDLRYLEHHPLVGILTSSSRGDELSRGMGMAGQQLRRELLAAVESLSPGPGIPFRAPQARTYNLLSLHFAQSMTVQDVAFKLGISRRQAHRDLSEALKTIAEVLLAPHEAAAAPVQESSAAQLSSLNAEVARLAPRSRPISIRSLLERCQETVARLAAQRGLNLVFQLPHDAPAIATDPLVAEQVLLSVLTGAIVQASAGDLRLDVATCEAQTTLSLRYKPERPAPAGNQPEGQPSVGDDPVTQSLVGRLGWRLVQAEQPGGTRLVTLSMFRRGSAILIIDDNAGLVGLIERYLTDHAYRVVQAGDGREGIRLAQELVPDAVLLDVMMPDMSGWEVLQRLRNHPRTATIPVIVCSVLNNPALAYSLGAALFLPKPINREDVLNALLKLGIA